MSQLTRFFDTLDTGLSYHIGPDFDLEDYELSDEAVDKAQDLIAAILQDKGQTIVEMARTLVPVRTGFLQSSIFFEVDGVDLRVGARASYAAYVEHGTSKMEPRPYLEPAIALIMPEIEASIDQVIEDLVADDQQVQEGDQMDLSGSIVDDTFGTGSFGF